MDSKLVSGLSNKSDFRLLSSNQGERGRCTHFPFEIVSTVNAAEGLDGGACNWLTDQTQTRPALVNFSQQETLCRLAAVEIHLLRKQPSESFIHDYGMRVSLRWNICETVDLCTVYPPEAQSCIVVVWTQTQISRLIGRLAGWMVCKRFVYQGMAFIIHAMVYI